MKPDALPVIIFVLYLLGWAALMGVLGKQRRS